ncbi:MAG: UDP-3-O-(3-hydroxymyristoyl)glucosamine N-acyltransferase [Alphaproteobacteria bacterium]|nr:UDP-3-O-(3-hydroxymyristoyl)glucosamine N-acyltransferase [Alphaproteobacteria bacterium]
MRGRSFTAGQLAERLGGVVLGDPGRLLRGVEDIREAGPDQLAFVANPRYRRHLATTRAGAVLVDRSTRSDRVTCLQVPDPYAAFAAALSLFHPLAWPEGGVDPRAAVSAEAHLGPNVRVEPFAVIGAGAQLGEGCWIQAGAFVGAGCTLGPRCRLMPGAVVMDGCVLGEGVWLNPGAVVGAEGFGFAPTPQGWVKIPQTGHVELGDGVELGANTCVDRPAFGVTRVGAGAKLDNLCQVGHAAQVGPDSLMVAYSGVAGSSRLGQGVTLAARASVLGHIELGDGVQVAAHSMVQRSLPAGAQVAGVPARDHKRWLRAASAAGELPELMAELRRLRHRVEELERHAAAPPIEDPEGER